MTTDLRVTFLGDSFVAGVGDPDHRGWVGRLAARTHRAGRPLTSYNLGIRGETSSDVLRRWRSEVNARLVDGCDQRLVVSFGVNDTTEHGSGTRLDAEASRLNLLALIREARVAGLPVLVVGPPPVDDAIHNERLAVLDGLFSRVCGAVMTPYVPVLASLRDCPEWMREVRKGDGSHPAAAGYQLFADVVFEPWWNWIRVSP